MLTVEEALLFQAVKDEEDRQAAIQQAAVAGGLGGAGLGMLGGTVPHAIGTGINKVKDNLAARQGLSPKVPYGTRLKPGFRFAGGLTGLILGGGLGAGTAALMKKDSEAGQLLANIQAKGGQIDENDERALAIVLGDIYNNPSQMV